MNTYEHLSDEELIQRLRGGETEITDYLMEKYKDLVRIRAHAIFLIGGDTDDLIQEGMIGLFKAVQNFREDKGASFRTYASVCVERQMYTTIQSTNRQKHLPLNSYISLSEGGEPDKLEGSWFDNPEALVIDRESTETLRQEIKKSLSPMENKVLDYYLQGYGYVKIAELMDKNPKSIDNALQRIRSKITRNFTLPFSEKK